MASTDIPPDMLTKWPPTEYYCVRRPLEEWVPPLEVLEEMRRVEPDRFREYGGTHEQLCMSLYQQGKTREEVFREVSSHMSHAEFKGFRKEEMLKTRDRLAIKLGLIPDLKEREENKIQSAGGFNRLRKTSQGTRFDVPPTKWIEEELIVFGAKSKSSSQAHLVLSMLTMLQDLMVRRAYQIWRERSTLRSDKSGGLA